MWACWPAASRERWARQAKRAAPWLLRLRRHMPLCTAGAAVRCAPERAQQYAQAHALLTERAAAAAGGRD